MEYGEKRLWVGTNGSTGIHVLRQEERGWRELVHGGPAAASYLAGGADGCVLAAVETNAYEGTPGGAVASCFLQEDGGPPEIRICDAAKGLAEGICHVAYAPKSGLVFASSYPQGSIEVLRLEEGGRLRALTSLQRSGSGPHPEQTGPHAHCCAVTGEERLLYVCDLGTDEIARYGLADPFWLRTAPSAQIREGICPLEPIRLPTGAGPRHMVLSKDESWLYVACELSNQVMAIRAVDGAVTQILDCRPGEEGFCALSSIRFPADGRSLVVGCRGMDGIWRIPLAEEGGLGRPVFCASDGSFPWDVLPLDEDICAVAFTHSGRVEVGRCGEERWEREQAWAVPDSTCLLLQSERQ